MQATVFSAADGDRPARGSYVVPGRQVKIPSKQMIKTMDWVGSGNYFKFLLGLRNKRWSLCDGRKSREETKKGSTESTRSVR